LETLVAIGRLNPEITRIILTGYATLESAIRATNEGVDGFLTKPFDNLWLRASIRDIRIRKRLRQFVPESVMAALEKSPGAISPRFHEATVLFSDIRGFVAMTHQASPEAIAGFLNEAYFTPMGEIAFSYGGTVDKHIGDSIMVIFGSPVTRDSDVQRAVGAAVSMQEKAREIDRELAGRNGFRLRTGIGLCTGKVFSGVLGSLRRKEFTSIGSVVNIAARLQSMARGGEVLMCSRTCARLSGPWTAEPLGPTRVRGLQEPLEVHRIRVG
jgi:adenylate cyclase